jgi:hypothetical protein
VVEPYDWVKTVESAINAIIANAAIFTTAPIG